MKILGNRVMLGRVPKGESSGFETVDVMDDFVSRGVVEQVGTHVSRGERSYNYTASSGLAHIPGEPSEEKPDDFAIGNIVVFAKFSPDTQELKFGGEEHKLVRFEDIIAVEHYAK